MHDRDARSVAADQRARPLFESSGVVLGFCFFIVVAFGWRAASAVWAHDRYFDTDDAMHMAQAREFIAGQGWFDMLERRLGPAPGTLMHWTRVVDLPLSALVRFFGLFGDADFAERATRIVYPLALAGILLPLLLVIARRMLDYRGAAAAALLGALSYAVASQFAPGRINHHNLQIVLVAGMMLATLDALDPARAARAWLAGVFAAASLAISIEGLPFIGAMVAVFGVVWVVRGAPFERALFRFGAGLALACVLAFVAVVPPALYLARACDAYSTGHGAAMAIGGAALALLARGSGRLANWRARALACGAAGALVLIAVAAISPNCIGSPYAEVDPLVRSVWLDHVSQSESLLRILRDKPWSGLPLAAPLVIGLACAVVAALIETGSSRARWATLAAFLGVGLIGSLWAVVVASYAAAFCGLGAGWAFQRLLDMDEKRALGLVGAGALVLSLAPQAWALGSIGARDAEPFGPPDACFESAAFRALDGLAPGLALGPIDAGPYLLLFTRLSPLDGPYHRDNAGLRLAIEAFLAPPAQARASLERAGVRYVLMCRSAPELSIYAKLAPRGLASDLRAGSVPDWLTPIATPGSSYRAYRID